MPCTVDHARRSARHDFPPSGAVHKDYHSVLRLITRGKPVTPKSPADVTTTMRWNAPRLGGRLFACLLSYGGPKVLGGVVHHDSYWLVYDTMLRWRQTEYTRFTVLPTLPHVGARVPTRRC